MDRFAGVLVCFLCFAGTSSGASAQVIGYSGGIDIGVVSDGNVDNTFGLSSLNLLGLNIGMEDVSATVEVGVPIPPNFSAQLPLGFYYHPFGNTASRPFVVGKLRPLFLGLAGGESNAGSDPVKVYGGFVEAGLGFQFGFFKDQLGVRASVSYLGGATRPYAGGDWSDWQHGGIFNLSLVSFVGLFDNWK